MGIWEEIHLRNIRPIVFWIPVTILFAAVVMSFVNQLAFQSAMESINTLIMNNLAWLLSISSVIFVGTCIWAYFSPLGRVKIGGDDATPLLSKMNWFTITLCTTIAVGLLFWGAAEPMFHVYEPPPSLGIEPGSAQAKIFAMATLFMHWSITPYAIYAVPALAFALAFYNKNANYSIGGMLSPIFGKYVQGVGGQIIDAAALLALVAGMSSGLGQGLLSLAGGIQRVAGIPTSPTVLAIICFVIIATVVISAVSGLMKGIRILSNFNAVILIVFGILVFIFGPTLYILSASVDGLGSYFTNFFSRSLNTGMISNDSWPQWWTNFYWAQWLAWAPVTALFLGRISRGYTVKQFIKTVMVFPSVFAILWMGIFGGSTIFFDDASGGAFRASLEQNGAESVIYMLFDAIPLGEVLIPLFILIAFISYVTAADSNTEAIALLCRGLRADELGTEKHTGIKVFFGTMIGVVSWSMTSFSGIDGIKMLANLGALPGLIIVLGATAVLIKFGFELKTEAIIQEESPTSSEKLVIQEDSLPSTIKAKQTI